MHVRVQNGKTALDHATENSHAEIVQLLGVRFVDVIDFSSKTSASLRYRLCVTSSRSPRNVYLLLFCAIAQL
jgi:hypothetical protein